MELCFYDLRNATALILKLMDTFHWLLTRSFVTKNLNHVVISSYLIITLVLSQLAYDF